MGELCQDLLDSPYVQKFTREEEGGPHYNQNMQYGAQPSEEETSEHQRTSNSYMADNSYVHQHPAHDHP